MKKEKSKECSLASEQKHIRTRDLTVVTEEKYNSFYEGMAKISWALIAQFHFKGDGDMEFNNSLNIPKKPPIGLYSSSADKEKEAFKLCECQVLVRDEFEYALFPRHLGLLVGIVNNDDILINVYREMLQESKTVDIIKRKLVPKAFEIFKKLIKADTFDDEDDIDTDTDEFKKDENGSEKKAKDDEAESGADSVEDEGEGGMMKKSK